jgi:ubiquitin C-terminal hydrolase
MVGLRNQGATCYLNSLLQSLYFTNAFRKVRKLVWNALDESDQYLGCLSNTD